MAKHKKHKGLFGIGSLETDVWKVGKGVAGAVLFDIVINKALRAHGGHHGGGDGGQIPPGPGPVEGVEGTVEGIMSGIEDITGMKGHPVLMAAAGFLVMQTQYREFGEGMALIGAYQAVTSHGYLRRMGGGMHGIGDHDVLAAIESGIEARVKEMKEGENQALVLADGVYDSNLSDLSDGNMYGDNEFEELFKKHANV